MKDKPSNPEVDSFSEDDANADIAMEQDQAKALREKLDVLKSSMLRPGTAKPKPLQSQKHRSTKKDAVKKEASGIKQDTVAQEAPSKPAMESEKPKVRFYANGDSVGTGGAKSNAAEQQESARSNTVLLGSITPAKKKPSKAKAMESSKEDVPANLNASYSTTLDTSNNPLSLSKDQHVNPKGNEKLGERALEAIMNTAGAFNTQSIQVERNNDEIHKVSVRTESDYLVESDGSKFDLLSDMPATDEMDLNSEVRSMLEASKLMGWDRIDITGSSAFISAAKKEAAGLGMEVVASIEVTKPESKGKAVSEKPKSAPRAANVVEMPTRGEANEDGNTHRPHF